MKKDDLKKAPKMFCESINVAYTPEYFIVGLTSGNQGSIYTLTPQHAKRLQQYLAHQVFEFEEKHGTIDATWDPKIVSPVQRANPPSELS
jgi:alpha-acetolactate decarboxylase